MSVRLLVGFVVLAALSAAVAQPTISKKHFKVLSAFRQPWSPGMVRENTAPAGGNVFELKIKVKKRGAYEIQKLIAAGEALPVEVAQNGTQKPTNNMRRCSKWELLSRSNANNKQPIDQSIAEVVATVPQAAAWLLYTFEGKPYLAQVAAMETRKQTSPNQ